jgi:hypothetical protein
MPDPWSVLGVAPGTGYDEARHAYLVRLQLVHPDRHQGATAAVRAEAERATRELTEAWEEVQGLLEGSAVVASGPGGPPGPPVGRDACLRWVLDRLIAAAAAEGDPLRADEVDLLLRPALEAPGGRRFQRWISRRRATLAGAVEADGADAWATALRTLQDGGATAVVLLLFQPR